MSDQADSERTRNCTRLLYIPTRKTPNRTMTARMIQAMRSSSFPVETRFHRTRGKPRLYRRTQGEVNTVKSGKHMQCLIRGYGRVDRGLLPWSVVSAPGADLEISFQGGDLNRAVPSVGVEVGGLVGNGVL